MTLFCCVLQQDNRHGDNLGLVSGAYSSIFLNTDNVSKQWKEKEKRHLDFVQ